MPRISEEMKQFSAVLEKELCGWPGVTSRPMFGMLAFYREGKIFAVLPRTRAFGIPNSIGFRFDPMPPDLRDRAAADSRISFEKDASMRRWYSFELTSADELGDGLSWLSDAYEAARKTARREKC